MFLNLHATQKILNENGTTSVIFNPSIIDETGTIQMQCSSILLYLPTSGDVFEIGADYSGELVKVV